MKCWTPEDMVLALYPTSRGFAFVLFEGPESPFDWGVKTVKEKHKNTKTFEEIRKLIDRYQPQALVFEETNSKESRRSSRIRKLYRTLTLAAESQYIEVCRYDKEMVRKCFFSAGACTKYEIAKAISTRIPAFGPRIPPVRKPWMSVDSRQSLFDAAALGITYFAHHIPSPYVGEN